MFESEKKGITILQSAMPSLGAGTLAFFTGLAVGVVFSLVKLPSPAPPLLGLIGLIGIFLGQRLLPFLAHFFSHR
jgi:XapX domain-containing protein